MSAILSDEELENARWVPMLDATQELGMTDRSIRRWGVQGKIRVGKTKDGRTMVDLSSVPEADEATLLEAAVSLAKEQRRGSVELAEIHLRGLKSLHEAFNRENQQLREHRDRLEKQMRRMHQTVEELGDGAVAREIALDEHSRSERRWDVGGSLLLTIAAEKMGLPKEAVIAAIQGLMPPADGANGDAAAQLSETAEQPDEADPDVDERPPA
jgi:hypothetical protein